MNPRVIIRRIGAYGGTLLATLRRCCDAILLEPRWPASSTMIVSLALTAVVAVMLVRDLRSPLLGHSDINQWIYQGYYFWKNLEVGALPHLHLNGDDVFYPYGVSNVYRPWNFESAYVYAAAYHVLGHGPWLQWYFLAAVLANSLLSYAVVRHEFGHRLGLLAGLVFAFGNFYALGRYPVHYGYSIVHWMTLSLLADFFLLRRVVTNAPWSMRLVALKAAAVTLCFGHDLAYVCGIALTSTIVTGCWIAALLTFRACRDRDAMHRWWRTQAEAWGRPARQQVAWSAGLVLVFLAAAWLYVPLVCQVFLEARENGSTTMPASHVYAPPGAANLVRPLLRLWTSPEERAHMAHTLTDRPGIFLVVGACGAIVLGSRRRQMLLMLAPFMFMVIVYVTYHWSYVDMFRVLPWLRLARVPGHFTLMMPVAFFSALLLALEGSKHANLHRILLPIVLGLFAAEAATTYRYLGKHAHDHNYRVSSEFFDFMATVRRYPGAAVMEWPFTVLGGNGVGNAELGVYGLKQVHTMAFPAFHDKKAMGTYFGRIHPRQIEPLLMAGWHCLNLPNHEVLPARQHRNFTDTEWQFLTEFFRRNDFCGILLYPDLVPASCADEFYRRFGQPVAETTMPASGRLQFLARPPQWQGDVDPLSGRELAFSPPVAEMGRRVLFGQPDGAGWLKGGWGDLTEKGCMSFGNACSLQFTLPPDAFAASERLVLEVQCHCESPHDFSVALNGRSVRRVEVRDPGPLTLTIDLSPSLLQGITIVRFDTLGPGERWRYKHTKNLGLRFISAVVRERVDTHKEARSDGGAATEE